HADGDAEVGLAQADRGGGEREGAGRGRAPVVDVSERDPREAHEGDDGVGVVDLVAAAEGELDVAPLHARVGKGPPDGDGPHVDPRLVFEAAERVETHTDDGDVRVHQEATGWKAKVTTSLPWSSVRKGMSTSSISMPA